MELPKEKNYTQEPPRNITLGGIQSLRATSKDREKKIIYFWKLRLCVGPYRDTVDANKVSM